MELKILDFMSTWCQPCRTMSPILEEVEKETGVTIQKINVDEDEEHVIAYGVRNIPTVLVFQNGEVVGRQVGVAPKKTYTDAIDALL